MKPAAPLVVDTSVALKWFFDEPDSPDAQRVLDALRTRRYRPIAPDLIYSEFADAVWKRVARRELSAADGGEIIAAFLGLPLDTTPAVGLLEPAYALALEFPITVYDALFVTLALLSDAEVVTADGALVRAVAPRLPHVRELKGFAR